MPGHALHSANVVAGGEQITDDYVDTLQDHRPPYSSPPSRRSHSRAVRLADSRLCAM